MKMSSAILITAALLFQYSTAQPSSLPSDGSGPPAPVMLRATADTLPPPDFVDVTSQPTLVSKKEPVYPKEALKAGLEGIVQLKIWVDEKGRSRQVELVKSDNEVFNQSAIDAAKQWVFNPAIKDGKPVSVWVVVPFKFKLWREPEDMQRNVEELSKTTHSPTVLVAKGPKDLKKLIEYPRTAIENRVQGAVFASVGLSDNLAVTEVQITHGLEKNCDRAVLTALSSFDFSREKDIKSMLENGKLPVIVEFVLPAKK